MNLININAACGTYDKFPDFICIQFLVLTFYAIFPLIEFEMFERFDCLQTSGSLHA